MVGWALPTSLMRLGCCWWAVPTLRMMRIVSLLPSATEIVCQLGLEEQLVGVTHECDWPAGVRRLPKVTRSLIPAEATSREIDALVRERLRTERALYSLDMAVLAELRPDLIVTQALCDVCAVAEAEVRAAACALPSQPRVVNLEPTCLADVFGCLRLVGAAAGCEERAEREIAALKRAWRRWRSGRSESAIGRVWCCWSGSIRRFRAGIGARSWCGWRAGARCVSAAGQRSRTLDWREVVAAEPEVLVVACCGFDVAADARGSANSARLSGLGRIAVRAVGPRVCRRRLGLFQPAWATAGGFAGNPGPRACTRRASAAGRASGGAAVVGGVVRSGIGTAGRCESVVR